MLSFPVSAAVIPSCVEVRTESNTVESSCVQSIVVPDGSLTDLGSAQVGLNVLSGGVLGTSGTQYLVWGQTGGVATESITANTQTLAGMAGAVNQLYCQLATAPGLGTSRTLTVRKNGVDTAVTLTIANTDVLGSQTGFSVTVVTTDLLSIKSTVSGTPAASAVSCSLSGPTIPTITTSTTTNLTGLLTGNGTDVDAIANVAAGQVLTSGTPPAWSASPSVTSITAQVFDKGGAVYDIRTYGAVCDNSTNDRLAIQAAIDAAFTAGGGTVFVPVSTGCVVGPHASGYGLLMKHGVRLVGSHKIGSYIRFSGTFTDSHIRASLRDDNNPNNYEVVGIENLHFLTTSASSIALLDVTGFRFSTFKDLNLQGTGTSDGTVAIRHADDNVAVTSSKSTFFNSFTNIGNIGPGFGTWLVYVQAHGNSNTSIFSNIEASSRVAFNMTGASGFDANLILENGYFAGDDNGASAVFTSNTIPTKLITRGISFEGYTLTPTRDIRNIFYSGTTTQFADFQQLTVVNNAGVGTSTFGSNAAKVLALFSGTAPTTSPSDTVQLYSKDVGAAGTAGFHIRDEPGNIYSFGSLALTMPTNAEIKNASGYLFLHADAGNIIQRSVSTGLVILNDTGGNVTLGTATIGSSASKTLTVGAGTANTTYPADAATLYVKDWNGAGTAAFFMNGEEGITHSFGSTVALGGALTLASTTDATTDTTGAFQNPGGASFGKRIFFKAPNTDAGATDATLCRDTTSHEVLTGTGTIGICLGTSSARFKRDIELLNLDGVGAVRYLKPRTYFYKPGVIDGGASIKYGFTAEEVADVLPQLVGLDKDGQPNTVDMLGMVPVLVKALQQQQTQIEDLQREVARLAR